MVNPGDSVGGFLFVSDDPELMAALKERRVSSDGNIIPGVARMALELILNALDRAIADSEGAIPWDHWRKCARRRVARLDRDGEATIRQYTAESRKEGGRAD